MAFPLTAGSTPTLDQIWDSIISWASKVKSLTTGLRDLSAAGPVAADRIWQYDSALLAARAQFAIGASTPGIIAYAQARTGNSDIVSEFNTMVAQIDATRTWITTNFPKDANGFLLDRTRDQSTASFVQRQFSTAALATFRTQLDALLATIA